MDYCRKNAITIIAILLTLFACWHTFECFSALLGNRLFAANLGPAALSANVHNLAVVLLHLTSFWAAVALAWLVRYEGLRRLSGQMVPPRSVSQSPNP